jgi:membrane protein implicated in regulation of membrane protease activity
MCHLILMLPVLGLPVFWLLPLSEALPIYGVILALSILVYVYVMRAMHHPVETGAEEILHSTGKVVEVGAQDVSVRVHSEMWRAVSDEKLKPGDLVEVVGIDGLQLRVRKHVVSPVAQNVVALRAQRGRMRKDRGDASEHSGSGL